MSIDSPLFRREQLACDSNSAIRVPAPIHARMLSLQQKRHEGPKTFRILEDNLLPGGNLSSRGGGHTLVEPQQIIEHLYAWLGMLSADSGAFR
jgi:hypothetical protein